MKHIKIFESFDNKTSIGELVKEFASDIEAVNFMLQHKLIDNNMKRVGGGDLDEDYLWEIANIVQTDLGGSWNPQKIQSAIDSMHRIFK